MSKPRPFFCVRNFHKALLENCKLSINIFAVIAMFFLYGIYASATEGISKAWISNIVHKKDIATAIGTYAGFQSICTMLASTFAGLIWYQFGSSATFIVTGLTTVLIIIYFGVSVRKPAQKVI